MRGDVVFRIYGVHTGRAKDNYFGTFTTRERAEAEVAQLLTREMHGENWAARYHNQGFAIRETAVETDFEMPPRPKPRDRYLVRATPVDNGPCAWRSSRIEVFERTPDGVAPSPCATWARDHAPYETFEPFRQGDRTLALISRDYTRSAVIDLVSGEVIAEEDETFYDDAKTSPGAGFCPVGFYVPDWWDVHDDSIIPGSEFWRAAHEWPRGELGFVWGCHWGDDGSWKLQALDLRDVTRGVLRREERFGYVAVRDEGWTSPCFVEAAPDSKGSRPPPFVSVSWYGASPVVEVRTGLTFDVTRGSLTEDDRAMVEALVARGGEDATKRKG